MLNQEIKFVCVNDLPSDSLLNRAKNCLAWLNKSGLRVSQASRFPKICRSIINPTNDIIQPGDKEFELVRQSFQDLQEMYFIIEEFDTELLGDLKTKFMLTLKDNPLPDKSTKQTKGRDTQLELFVGAICKRAGMELSPGDHGEPDWMVQTPAFKLAVEVKRCKSVPNIEDQVKKAAKQIKQSGRGGVIVLDTTHAFNPSHEPICKPADDDLIAKAHEQLINHAMKYDLKNIQQWVDGKSVGIIYLHNTVVRPGIRSPNLGIEWATFSLWCEVKTMQWKEESGNPYHEFNNLFWTAQPKI